MDEKNWESFYEQVESSFAVFNYLRTELEKYINENIGIKADQLGDIQPNKNTNK